MTNMEIILLIVSLVMSLTTFILTLWYRELHRQVELKDIEIARQDEMLDLAKEKNVLLTKQLYESDKKAKLSGDVLAVLNDMKQGGAVFEVTRIDRSDIFFHNGSQYR
jgi:hypothetical protein